MNQRRFMIGPQTWSSTSAFPVFNNICDLAASSLSIIFHGGEATVALRSFMKQGSLFWDFFNKSYFFLYFRVGVFMFVYVHSCAKICIKCLGPILTFKSLKVWKCGFETSCSKGGFDSQRPRDFAAPRAPAGGAAFWRPAPRAPPRPCQPWCKVRGHGSRRAALTTLSNGTAGALTSCRQKSSRPTIQPRLSQA